MATRDLETTKSATPPATSSEPSSDDRNTFFRVLSGAFWFVVDTLRRSAGGSSRQRNNTLSSIGQHDEVSAVNEPELGISASSPTSSSSHSALQKPTVGDSEDTDGATRNTKTESSNSIELFTDGPKDITGPASSSTPTKTAPIKDGPKDITGPASSPTPTKTAPIKAVTDGPKDITGPASSPTPTKTAPIKGPKKFEPLKPVDRLKSVKFTFDDGDIKREQQATLTKNVFASVAYDMNKETHGIAVIINNKHCDGREPREGTDNDRDNLIILFQNLGYIVWVYEDLDANAMKTVMDDIKYEGHTDYDSFVCCIMTHGDNGTLTGSNNQPVRVEDLIENFNGDSCPDLKGKPKIFLIQACRGHGKQGAVPAGDAMVPNTADFVFCYATPPGYQAWRDSNESGSWYIKEVCKAFRSYAMCGSFVDIMQKVHENVGDIKFGTEGREVTEAPEMTSRLRKNIFFF